MDYDYTTLKSIRRIEALLELQALRADYATNVAPTRTLERMAELCQFLWPSGLRAEHARNPMNHVGRSRTPVRAEPDLRD